MFNKNFYERERVKSDQGKLNNLGFTLIELLVVISIIGFLATASMVVFNSVRMKARDTSRKASMKQLQTAIQLYYDSNNAYPSTGGAAKCLGYSTSQTCWNGNVSGLDGLNAALAPFISKLPQDPLIGKRTRGNAFLYGDQDAVTAWHCSGASYPAGPYLFWLPDSGSVGSDTDCQGLGFMACCGAVPCAESYFCAWQL